MSTIDKTTRDAPPAPAAAAAGRREPAAPIEFAQLLGPQRPAPSPVPALRAPVPPGLDEPLPSAIPELVPDTESAEPEGAHAPLEGQEPPPEQMSEAEPSPPELAAPQPTPPIAGTPGLGPKLGATPPVSPELVQQIVAFAGWSKDKQGRHEFTVGIQSGRLSGTTLRIQSLGRGRIGLEVRGAGGSARAQELAPLLAALEQSDVEVASLDQRG